MHALVVSPGTAPESDRRLVPSLLSDSFTLPVSMRLASFRVVAV